MVFTDSLTGYIISTRLSSTDTSIILKSTNGGDNWSINHTDSGFIYKHIQFIDRDKGWAYWIVGGIHTTTGGMMGIQHVSNEKPESFKLYQNYPNPFNPVTNIIYQLTRQCEVILSVYDVTGKMISELVNQEQSAGTYKLDFDGTNYSSGIYFYSFVIDGILIDTKKMLLIK